MKVAPAINSRWHSDRLEIFDDINIGVGPALGEKGLIVPVLSRVQTLSLQRLAAGLDGLIETARADNLTSPAARGGHCTLSNPGLSRSLFATPLLIPHPHEPKRH